MRKLSFPRLELLAGLLLSELVISVVDLVIVSRNTWLGNTIIIFVI